MNVYILQNYNFQTAIKDSRIHFPSNGGGNKCGQECKGV